MRFPPCPQCRGSIDDGELFTFVMQRRDTQPTGYVNVPVHLDCFAERVGRGLADGLAASAGEAGSAARALAGLVARFLE